MPNKRLKEQIQQEAAREEQLTRQQWRSIAIVGGMIVAIVAVLAIVLVLSTKPPAGPYDLLTQGTTVEGFPVLGDPNTAFLIAEVTDFNCVQCSVYYPNEAQIIDSFIRNGHARLAWVLTGDDANATTIDQAALCAQSQHKFWQARDALFAYQSKLVPGQSSVDAFSLAQVTQALASSGNKINTDQIDLCVAGAKTRPILEAGGSFKRINQIPGLPTLLWSSNGTRWQRFIGNDNQPILSGGVDLQIIGRTIEADHNARLLAGKNG